MCSNALLDSFECFMEDLVCCFEDFVSRSLWMLTLCACTVIAIVVFMLRKLTERSSDDTNTGWSSGNYGEAKNRIAPHPSGGTSTTTSCQQVPTKMSNTKSQYNSATSTTNAWSTPNNQTNTPNQTSIKVSNLKSHSNRAQQENNNMDDNSTQPSRWLPQDRDPKTMQNTMNDMKSVSGNATTPPASSSFNKKLLQEFRRSCSKDCPLAVPMPTCSAVPLPTCSPVVPMPTCSGSTAGSMSRITIPSLKPHFKRQMSNSECIKVRKQPCGCSLCCFNDEDPCCRD